VEDPVAAPTINPVSAPLVGANLIVLSSGSEDEVDWEALIAEDEVN
jgi:glycine cleavage system protein P-like pyridoxal-binding family